MSTSSLGCFFAVVAAIVGAVGDTLLRIARDGDHRGSLSSDKEYYGTWLVGMTMSTVAESLLTMMSLSFASATLVTPIAALRVALNTILSNCFLKARLIVQHFLGVALVGVGILLAFSASGLGEAVKPYTIQQLFAMYTQSAYLGFAVLCLLCGGLFGYVSFGKAEQRETTEIIPGRRRTAYDGQQPNSRIDIELGQRAAGLASYGMDGSDKAQRLATDDTVPTRVAKEASDSLHTSLPRKLVRMRVRFPWGFARFSTAAVSGIAGGHAIVVADSLLRIMNHDEAGPYLAANWRFTTLFLLLSLLLLIQIYALNKGIEVFEGLNTIPQANAVLISVACLASLNLFSESLVYSTARLGLFVCGTCCVVGGLLLISQADTKREIADLEALELQLASRSSSSESSSMASSDTDDEANRYVESLVQGGMKDSPLRGFDNFVEGSGQDVMGVNVYGKQSRKMPVRVGPVNDIRFGTNVVRELISGKHGGYDTRKIAYDELRGTDNDRKSEASTQLDNRLIASLHDEYRGAVADWTESMEQIAIDSPADNSASPLDHQHSRIHNLLDLDSDHVQRSHEMETLN